MTPTPEQMQSHAAALLAARQRSGMTIDEVVERSEKRIHRSTLSRLENGIRFPSVTYVAVLSKIYGETPQQILPEDSDLRPMMEEIAVGYIPDLPEIVVEGHEVSIAGHPLRELDDKSVEFIIDSLNQISSISHAISVTIAKSARRAFDARSQHKRDGEPELID